MVQAVPPVTVGVLALQGGFSEHYEILLHLSKTLPIECILVRTPAQLALCSALILPGGESTTISLLAQKSGLLEPLRDLVQRARRGEAAIWGTCAGMILLGEEVVGKKEGYEGIGGIDVEVVRNQWGRQTESFSHALDIPCLSNPSKPFPSTFIRAPVVHTLFSALSKASPNSPALEVLARVPRSILPLPSQAALATGGSELGPDADVVMLRQGNVVASSFHPELTGDWRVHEWWVRSVVLGDGRKQAEK